MQVDKDEGPLGACVVCNVQKGDKSVFIVKRIRKECERKITKVFFCKDCTDNHFTTRTIPIRGV